jgi:hypothetical protein
LFFSSAFRFGRVQSVKILKKNDDSDTSGAATVAFMDIKSANIAFNTEQKIDDRVLRTDYYDPSAFDAGGQPAPPAASGLNSSRLHPEEAGGACPAPAGPQNRHLPEDHYDSSVRSSHGGYSGSGGRDFGYRPAGSRYTDDGYGSSRQRLIRTAGYRSQAGYSQDK